MKLETIAEKVLDSTERSCRCGFIRDRITDEVFRCFPSSPQTVTYRAIIHGTAGATSAQLFSHIEQWTTEGAALIIDQVLLSVDASCSVAISSIFINEECPKAHSTTSDPSDFVPASSESEIPAIIGGSTVAVIAVIVIASTAVAITILVLKNHCTDKKLNDQQPR